MFEYLQNQVLSDVGQLPFCKCENCKEFEGKNCKTEVYQLPRVFEKLKLGEIKVRHDPKISKEVENFCKAIVFQALPLGNATIKHNCY